jgi:hypothetical protein
MSPLLFSLSLFKWLSCLRLTKTTHPNVENEKHFLHAEKCISLYVRVRERELPHMWQVWATHEREGKGARRRKNV